MVWGCLVVGCLSFLFAFGLVVGYGIVCCCCFALIVKVLLIRMFALVWVVCGLVVVFSLGEFYYVFAVVIIICV